MEHFITLKKIHHRGQDRIGIFFKYDFRLKEAVRNTGAYYSKTLQCWHLPYDKLSYHKLRKRFPNSLLYDKNFKIYLSQRRYAQATIDAYYQSIVLFFEWYCGEGQPPLNITLLNTYNHTQFIEKKRSRSLQNRWVSGMKLFLEKFEDMSISSADIERPKKSLHLPNVLSVEEVKSFIESFKNLKHRTLFMLVYACGLRKSEVIHLKIKHLDFGRNILRIKNSKGAKDRDVPIPKNLKPMLHTYMRRYNPKVYVFNGKVGERYSGSSINKLVKAGARRIHLKKVVTCHTLRHSYATHLMEQNINLRYIQEALGHRSSKTTEIYTKLSKENIAKLVSPIDFW